MILNINFVILITGPTHGGTEITVEGSNFIDSEFLVCLFFDRKPLFSNQLGNPSYITGKATYISDSRIKCISPVSFKTSSIELYVSLDANRNNQHARLEYLSPGLKFTYDSSIIISSILPDSGPSCGNFSVFVKGGPFISNAEYSCLFGDTPVKGFFINEGVIRCIGPNKTPGTYFFEVSQNGIDFTDFRKQFKFYENPLITHIYPVSGPVECAGTAVKVFGYGFVNTSSLVCRFGNFEAPSQYISDKEILCVAPSLTSKRDLLSWFDLNNVKSHQFQVDPKIQRQIYPNSYNYPLYLGFPTTLEVTNNGQDYTENGVTFLYQQDIIILNISNNRGPALGGTPIFISGIGFVNTTDLKCRVGYYVVDAFFLTRESILCFTPPLIRAEASGKYREFWNSTNMPHSINFRVRPFAAPTNVLFLEVANNGIDFSNFGFTYEYISYQSRGTYQPGYELATELKCPRGTYCKSGIRTNFTLCPKGTYQTQIAQEKCVRCPIGYMCPEKGLPIPRICPSGFVCDVTGIEQNPNPCPEGHFCLEGTATSSVTCTSSASQALKPGFSLSDQHSKISIGNEGSLQSLTFSGRNSACWSNSTEDFGLQASKFPSRLWSEKYMLPLDFDSPYKITRGRFCLDDSCLKIEDEFNVRGDVFDYASTGFSLRRPVPCPQGMYCHPGTAVNKTSLKDYSTPQPCFESMYCPEGSTKPNGITHCPRGFYCPFAQKIPCPVGNFCPKSGHWEPIPCEPGYFNFMVGQFECTICPIGYICPTFGRLDPLICPAGFVCSKIGLLSPNHRCPAGFYCQSGTQTTDPFRNDTTHRPYPCSPGTYCLSGVGSVMIKVGDFWYAQPCTEGFFCEAASSTAKGSGLCPPGFSCPQGTSNPIPTPKGHFSQFAGTVKAAACLPGYYTPTIQSKECYPCPPGTSCEVEGLYEAEICPPGTYRGTLEEDDKTCTACPQGSWSKNWHLLEKGECVKCPTGVNCPVDGMTTPCSFDDLPQPFVPIVNLNGLPVPEYHYPETDLPPYFSIDECLSMNPSLKSNDYTQEFFFGELIPPYIDILGRGAHFRSSDEVSLKYSSVAKCFRNPSPLGSPLYRRMINYYGPQFDIQTGYPHQGYGTPHLMNNLYGVSPPPGFDISLKYFYSKGMMGIEFPHTRIFDSTKNCTTGFMLMNSSLVKVDPQLVFTNPETDLEGGYDIEKCPVYDVVLDCYIDPKYEIHPNGTCCHIESKSQRAILHANDQFYPGTCEADKICLDYLRSEAKPCDDGYVCDESTTDRTSRYHPCREGYFCEFGTTPDASLESPQGQFANLCPSGFVCGDQTGMNYHEIKCPPGFFCPTGTANPTTGALADDAINRNIAERDANPYLDHVYLSYYREDNFQLLSAHDIRCRSGAENEVQRRFRGKKIKSLTKDPNGTVINEAVSFDKDCARDHKWKIMNETVRRNECDCNIFFFMLIAVFRLWQCTANEPLDNLGIGAVLKVQNGSGKRDYWFKRVHRDFDLAMSMDEKFDGEKMHWGDGAVCKWPESEILTLIEGKIPYIKENNEDGFGGRFVKPVPYYGIPHDSGGLLEMVNEGTYDQPNVNFTIQLNKDELKSFPSYSVLKDEIESIFLYQEFQNDERESHLDPFTYNLYRSIKLIEEYGANLINLVYFQEGKEQDHAGVGFEVDRKLSQAQNLSEFKLSSTIFLIPGRMDMCECQNALRCPNGTDSRSGSKNLEDCKTYDKEVLRRISVIPSKYKQKNSKIHNSTDFSALGGMKSYNIDTIELKSLETVVFTLDLAGLSNNFTYGEHYQISIYNNCKPCPPRYNCDKNTKNSTCASPRFDQQIGMLNSCLKENRRPVCVHSNGTTVDLGFCQQQKKNEDRVVRQHSEINNNDVTLRENLTKNSFESSYLLFSEPDIDKCTSTPFFCDEKRWENLIFRRLCQDNREDNLFGPIYDCSLVDKYDEFITWQNEQCCLQNSELRKIGGCSIDMNMCERNSTFATLFSKKIVELFVTDRGFVPPVSRPQGQFVMNIDIQEAAFHPSPLSLFNVKNNYSSKLFTLEQKWNKEDSIESWKTTQGCCDCKRQKMPSYFYDKEIDNGFSDNKHREIQISLTSMDDNNLTVVVELLHGSYYSEFDSYFGTHDFSEMRIHTPSRFKYRPNQGTNSRSTWFTLIERRDFHFQSLELPLNLPRSEYVSDGIKIKSSLFIDRSNRIEIGDKSYRKKRENKKIIIKNSIPPAFALRDPIETVKETDLWWTEQSQSSTRSYDSSFIALPFFPYFSNCDGYDSHVGISRLLEEHPDCTMVDWNDTKPVNQYPWENLLYPISDTCQVPIKSHYTHEESDSSLIYDLFKGIDLSCTFEEQVELPSAGTRWFESDGGTVLFYMSHFPIPADHFESRSETYEDRNNEVQYQWGRTPELNNIRHSFKVKPVKVSELHGGMKNTVPRKVQLDLEYYQINKGEKRLVGANIYFDELCTTIKPIHHGGNEEILAVMLSKGILPCEVDINGNLKSYEYSLEVHMYPLDWFNLLNRFEFEGQIYFGFFTLVGITSSLLAMIIWIMNRLMTKLRHPPPFHGRSFAKLISNPAWYGCFLATIPYILVMLCIYLWFNVSESRYTKQSLITFEWIHGDWLDTSKLDEERIEKYKTGRIGVGILAIGLYASSLCASLIVPNLNKIEQEALNGIQKQGEGKMMNITKKNSDDNAQNMLKWKRAHLIWIGLCVQCALIWQLEFSYSSFFEENIFMYIVFFKVVQVLCEILLQSILKEHLMSAPLVVLIQMMRSMVTMGARDLVEFVFSYFVELSLIIIERLYIGPWMKTTANLFPRWKMMAQRKLFRNKRLTRFEKKDLIKKWEKINENIQLRNEGIEPLLDSFIVYSVEITGSILLPIMILILMAFSAQTKISFNYGIQTNEMGYYMMFATYMIPWNAMVDVFILNSQELVHGWRLYDYMAYQRYRFTMRETRWVLNSQAFDESISESMQSIDLLSFSSQYYFILSLYAMGMLNCIFAVTIFLRVDYNLFGDPVMPIIMLTSLALCDLIKLVLELVGDMSIHCFQCRGIWKAKQIEGTMDDEIAAKLVIGEGRQLDLEKERLELQAMNNEKFRHQFIDKNRPWILQHLVELVTPRSMEGIGPDGRPLTDYLRNVYEDLTQMGQGEKKNGDRSDISSDDDDDEELEKRRKWSQLPVGDSSRTIAQHWLRKARRRRVLGKCVSPIITKHMKDFCSSCTRSKDICDNLKAGLAWNGTFDPLALDKLIGAFEVKYSASENDPNLWKSFFKQEANFMTICNHCLNRVEINRTVHKSPSANQVTRATDISSDEEEDEDSFNAIVVVRSSKEGKIMSKWLNAARKTIGGEFPKLEANEEIARYVGRMKKKELSTTLIPTERRDTKLDSSNSSFGHHSDLGRKHFSFNASTQALAIKWVRAARESAKRRLKKRSEQIRTEVNETLHYMREEDDWFFGLQLRKEGEFLKSEGEKLNDDAAMKREKLKFQILKKEEELYAYREQINFQLKSKQNEFQENVSECNRNFKTGIELRSQEINRLLIKTKENQDEEKQKSREENGAVPSRMLEMHQKAISNIEESLALERERAEERRSKAETELEKVHEQYSRVLMRSVLDKERVTGDDIEQIQKDCIYEIERFEKEWRLKTTGWLSVATRKVKLKQEEEVISKAKNQARKSKTGKMRKL